MVFSVRSGTKISLLCVIFVVGATRPPLFLSEANVETAMKVDILPMIASRTINVDDPDEVCPANEGDEPSNLITVEQLDAEWHSSEDNAHDNQLDELQSLDASDPPVDSPFGGICGLFSRCCFPGLSGWFSCLG